MSFHQINIPKEINNSHDDDELSLAKRNSLLYSACESDVQFVFTVKSNLEIIIYGHKRILSIGSCVFDQMFNGLMATTSTDTSIKSETIVCITDIPIECFKNFLMFIYIGAVELNSDNIVEVMYVAHKYQVCKLETLCCNFLYKNMDISNVLEIYESTLIFNNSITTQCLQWIDDLFDDLSKWEGFMNLKKATLMELLTRDRINISELNLFKAVYRWAEKQCCDASIEPSDSNLRSCVDNFKYIRFPTMTLNEFAECTRYGFNILTAEEKVDVWDAISNVKPSIHFNSTKRMKSPMTYKAITFPYRHSPFGEKSHHHFEFHVSRIVHLTSITVIRNCHFIVMEKESGDIRFARGTECDIRVGQIKSISYSFVPNVKYALVTVDSSFDTGNRMGSSNFKSYADMQKFYNRITWLDKCNFEDHDPFIFDVPQHSLIRVLSYKTSK